MNSNIISATLLAVATGMVINSFGAGVLSELTKELWKDIWKQLTSTLILATLISMVAHLLPNSTLGATLAFFGIVMSLYMTGVFYTSNVVMFANVTVAFVSLLIGESAATGDIARTEMIVSLGGLGAVVIGATWGVLHLVFRKKQER
jgi:hypothetical protein